MSDNCPVSQTIKTSRKRWDIFGRVSRYNLFKKDPIFSEAYTKYAMLTDRINPSKALFVKYREQFINFWNSIDDIEKAEFNSSFRKIVNDVRRKSLDPKAKVDIAGELMNATGAHKHITSSEFISTIHYLETIMDGAVNKYMVLKSLSNKRSLIDVFDNLPNSLKYPMLEILKTDITNLPLKITEKLESIGISGKANKNLTTDIMGGPLGTDALRKFSGNLRQMYTTLKFGPVTGLVGGSLLLLNNMALGVLNLMGRRRGLEGIVDHEIIDNLIKGEGHYEGILKDYSRAGSISRENLSINGKNAFYKFADKILDSIPFLSESQRNGLESILLSGIHTIRDMGAQTTVTKTSIGQALAKNCIDAGNINEFMKMYREGTVNTKFINRIRADAHMYYTSYFTSGNLLALNRHSFSRRWMFMNLQNYVTIRSDEMFRGIRNAYEFWNKGGIRTRGEFVDYIHTDNQELKALINNLLLSAKASIYINEMVNGTEEDSKASQTRRYFIGMSEYLSSLDSQFFFRLLTSPLSGAAKYVRYNNVTGQEDDFIEGISVAFLNSISETMSMLFREGKVLDVMIDPMVAYIKTGDLDFSRDVAGIDLDKLTNGMGRFMLVPGEDNYGQKAIQQSDDFIGRILLSYDSVNEASRESQKLRGIGDAEKMLNDGKGFLVRALQYLPILGKTINLGSEKIGWNEAKYKTMQDFVENNPIMKEIWDGKLPLGVLNNPDITKDLYKELTEFQYYNKKYAGGGKHSMSEYGLSSMEEDVFIDNIAKAIYGSNEEMDKALVGKSKGDKELIKVIAAAEAGEPGSSRIVLSYLANKELQNLKQTYFGDKYLSSADIPLEQEDEMKRMIVEKYYPYMYASDKTAWYKLGIRYMEAAELDIFKGISSDEQLKGFVNSMGFLDFMIKLEGDKGEVSAPYIKNSFNFGTKYITNEKDRIAIVKHTMSTIDSLSHADISQKRLMRTGILSANIDFYNKLKQDKQLASIYANDIKQFENMVRGNIDDINNKGIKGAEGDLDDTARSQYYGTYGKSYVKSKNDGANGGAIKDFQNKVNKTYQPMREGIPSYIVPSKYYYSNPKDIGDLSPKRHKIYARFYEQQLAAYSKGLVDNKSAGAPGQYVDSLRFTLPSFYKKSLPTPAAIKFKRPPKKYVSYKTRSDLPGSTDDGGAG